MWLWKIFFPVTICLFGCNHGSEFIVPPNDGKMRYFRGFETDEFHFKIKNDAANAKNVSYIYLLDKLDARTNYGRYMRISVRYDLHGTTWLNIYSSNSGLTASERTAKFRDRPGQDGFRGYWIRRQRHLFNGRLNRWEFGQEWDSIHPIMKLELKFPFFPQFFALEGFSTWKLEQILFSRPSSSFGFFSSADLSMVHMPTFFPPMDKIIAPQADAPSTQQNLKFSSQEIFSHPTTSKSSSIIDGSIIMENLSAQKDPISTAKIQAPVKLLRHQKLNPSKKLRVKTEIDAPSKSNYADINIYLPNITYPKTATVSVDFPSLSVPKITLPSVTIPEVNIPAITIPSIEIPKITVPSFTLPKVNIPPVTIPSIEIPKVTVFSFALPKVNNPSVTKPSIEISKITLPSVTISKANIPSATIPSIGIPKVTSPSVTFPKVNTFVTIPSVEMPKTTLTSVTVPKINIASVTTQSIELPKVTSLNVTLPVTMPKVEMQKITSPSVTTPKINVRSATGPSVEFTKIKVSNVTIPEINIPSVTLPSVELPKITVPNVTIPEINIPSVTLPVELPKITVPDVTLPKIKVPPVTLPTIELPKITVPDITLPKIKVPPVTLPRIEHQKITWPKLPYPTLTSTDIEIPIVTLLPILESNVTSPPKA